MPGMPVEPGAGETRFGMAEANGNPGKKSIFPAFERESKTQGAYRQAGSGEAEKMKCTYCDDVDHLEPRCPTRAADRRKEVCVGIIVFLVSFPAYILGFVLGMWFSALKAGFSFTKDFWPEAWTTIRGKKDDGESSSV